MTTKTTYTEAEVCTTDKQFIFSCTTEENGILRAFSLQKLALKMINNTLKEWGDKNIKDMLISYAENSTEIAQESSETIVLHTSDDAVGMIADQLVYSNRFVFCNGVQMVGVGRKYLCKLIEVELQKHV